MAKSAAIKHGNEETPLYVINRYIEIEINYIAHYLNIEYAMIYLDIVLLRFHQEIKSLTRSFCDVVFFLD